MIAIEGLHLLTEQFAKDIQCLHSNQARRVLQLAARFAQYCNDDSISLQQQHTHAMQFDKAKLRMAC